MKLADIATHVGVSVSTVSRVLNGSQLVSAEKEAIIKKAMKDLGYEPPPADRRRGARKPPEAVARAKSIKIVLVGEAGLNWITDYAPVYAYALNGMEESLTELKLSRTFEKVATAEELGDLVCRGAADGYIVLDTTGRFTTSYPAELRGAPVVAMMGIHDKAPFDRVTPDHYAAGEAAANYLIGRGCKLCAALGGKAVLYQRRIKSFLSAVQEAGLKMLDLAASDLVLRGPQMHQAFSEAVVPLVDSLLTETARPLGLFVTVDVVAPCVYMELAKVGLAVGKDIHVVTCNNERPYLNPLSPQPAVIDVHAADIGRRAVLQRLQRMEFPNEAPVSVLMPPELIEPA